MKLPNKEEVTLSSNGEDFVKKRNLKV